MASQTEYTETLTPRQLQLLQAVAGCRDRQSYSPTIGELALQLRLSRSTIFEHIEQLLKKDLLCHSPGRARSLSPTSKAQELLEQLAGDGCDSPAASDSIPLLGRVAAGVPIQAIENADCLSLSSHFGNGDNVFALQVAGDSMIDAGINDGDYVICKRASAASDGQLVVAIVDNEEATVKRFYKEKGLARLEPANDNYQPIYSSNCHIQGIVIGLLRRF